MAVEWLADNGVWVNEGAEGDDYYTAAYDPRIVSLGGSRAMVVWLQDVYVAAESAYHYSLYCRVLTATSATEPITMGPLQKVFYVLNGDVWIRPISISEVEPGTNQFLVSFAGEDGAGAQFAQLVLVQANADDTVTLLDQHQEAGYDATAWLTGGGGDPFVWAHYATGGYDMRVVTVVDDAISVGPSNLAAVQAKLTAVGRGNSEADALISNGNSGIFMVDFTLFCWSYDESGAISFGAHYHQGGFPNVYEYPSIGNWASVDLPSGWFKITHGGKTNEYDDGMLMPFEWGDADVDGNYYALTVLTTDGLTISISSAKRMAYQEWGYWSSADVAFPRTVYEGIVYGHRCDNTVSDYFPSLSIDFFSDDELNIPMPTTGPWAAPAADGSSHYHAPPAVSALGVFMCVGNSLEGEGEIYVGWIPFGDMDGEPLDNRRRFT